jgi:hypothetical protein
VDPTIPEMSSNTEAITRSGSPTQMSTLAQASADRCLKKSRLPTWRCDLLAVVDTDAGRRG